MPSTVSPRCTRWSPRPARSAGAQRLSAKRTSGGGLGEPGGAAQRPVREADEWKGSGETGRGRAAACPRSGPVEGVWGNREVYPATNEPALLAFEIELQTGRDRAQLAEGPCLELA